MFFTLYLIDISEEKRNYKDKLLKSMGPSGINKSQQQTVASIIRKNAPSNRSMHNKC